MRFASRPGLAPRLSARAAAFAGAEGPLDLRLFPAHPPQQD